MMEMPPGASPLEPLLTFHGFTLLFELSSAFHPAFYKTWSLT